MNRLMLLMVHVVYFGCYVFLCDALVIVTIHSTNV